MFHFRALGGVFDVTAGLLQVLPWTMFASMMWVVLLLLARRVLRSDYLALAVIGGMTLFMSPAMQPAYLLAMFIGNAAVLLIAMRVGFLALISSVAVGQIIQSLPLSPGTPGVIGSLSWISVLAITVPALFGFTHRWQGSQSLELTNEQLLSLPRANSHRGMEPSPQCLGVLKRQAMN